MPSSNSLSAIQLAFVSTIRPVVSSSPVDSTTARRLDGEDMNGSYRAVDCAVNAGFEKPCGRCTHEGMGDMKRLLSGRRIDPPPVSPSTTLTELIDNAFQAYNGARLREAVQLFTREMLQDDVTVGISLSGALTPAG